MSPVYGDVRRWTSAPLGAAGDRLRADVTALEASRDTLESRGVPPSWEGLARLLAEARMRRLVARMDEHVEGKRRMQRGVYTAEEIVSEIERLVADVERAARSSEVSIADDGTVSDASTPPRLMSVAEAADWQRERTAVVQRAADDVTRILNRAVAADAALADSIPAGHVEQVDEYGQASPGVAERWAELSEAERRAVVEEMIRELAEANGVDRPTVAWDDDFGANGRWEDGERTVRLDPSLLETPRILHTVAHELRHARQFEAMRDLDGFHWPWQDDPFDEHRDDGITQEQVEEWEDNFDDYQSTASGDSYEDYFNQPVEEDARDSGQAFLDGLTVAELDRLLEEAR